MEKYPTCFIRTETTFFCQYFISLLLSQFFLLFNCFPASAVFLLKFYKFTDFMYKKETVEFESAASQCTCFVRLGKDTCWHCYHTTTRVIAACVCVRGGGKGWRALRCLIVIDLIMENSPQHCSQRVQGLWHLYEKYSCCAGFCHKTPVDKAQLWQTAKREGEREREGHFKEGKRGMEGDWWWRGDRIMQHSSARQIYGRYYWC